MIALTLLSGLVSMAPAARAALASALGEFGSTAGTALVTSLWQGVVIVCGLEICMRLMPRVGAAQRFAIWAAGFVVAAGLPLMRAEVGGNAAGLAGIHRSVNGPLRLDARWGLAIAGLWVAVSLLRAASLAAHSMRLRRLWKAAQPVEVSAALKAAVENVRGGRVRICTTEILDRPSVIGFLAPRILIPAWLMARLSEAELEQIVLHEAEHLRRGDDWTNLAQKLWLVAFPLNPALAWMEHRLCQQREMACDEGVVRITNAPRAYAACLATLAERGLDRRAEALSLGAWHRRSELVDRVHGILLRRRGMSRAAAGALLGAVGCALVTGGVEMARAPQLVEFVPKQTLTAMTPERQRQMTEMLARESAEAKVAMPAGFQAVQAKAVAPRADRSRAAARHEVRKGTSAAKKAAMTEAPMAASVATAERVGDRVTSADGQQWVVLAAWEEVRTVSRDSISDFDRPDPRDEAKQPGGLDKAANDQNPQTARGAQTATERLHVPTRNYTVTQLILRVVPASSNSTQPAAGFSRGGWFVFQL